MGHTASALDQKQNANIAAVDFAMDGVVLEKVAICEFSTYRWSFFEDVIRYSTLGFDSIGIWRQKLDDFGIEAAIDVLLETNMKVSSLHWAGGFTGDGQTMDEAVSDASDAIQDACRLEADCLIIHPGSRNHHTFKNTHKLLRLAMNRVIPIAQDYGVKLVVEPFFHSSGSRMTFINHLDEVAEILDQYSPHDLGLVLDLYHAGFDSEVFEALPDLIDRIDLVQVADRRLAEFECQPLKADQSHRIVMGSGDISLTRWIQSLQELGYRGRYEVELHGTPVVSMDYFELLEDVRTFFSCPEIQSALAVKSIA
ncbi:MAG: sugar phosphate isomerase/epimerase family protein [Planctomycetota bacterium]